MSGRQFKFIRAATLVALLISFSAPVCGVEFDYDIFIQKDTLSLWIDVTPALTQPRLEDLLAGLNIYLGLDFSLEKKGALGIFKSRLRKKTAIIITHNLIDDIYRLKILTDTRGEISFDNLLQLREFLSDSLVFPIADIEPLPQDKKFRLSFDLMVKSGSNGFLGIAGIDNQEKEELSSEIKFLENMFSQFLKIIGFGRSAYHVDSPRFIIKELPNSSP